VAHSSNSNTADKRTKCAHSHVGVCLLNGTLFIPCSANYSRNKLRNGRDVPPNAKCVRLSSQVPRQRLFGVFGGNERFCDGTYKNLRIERIFCSHYARQLVLQFLDLFRIGSVVFLAKCVNFFLEFLHAIELVGWQEFLDLFDERRFQKARAVRENIERPPLDGHSQRRTSLRNHSLTHQGAAVLYFP